MASQGDIYLLGFLDRASLEGLYAACDVFALPSSHEGTGLVALEAASYGAKVVITKNGGPPDYLGEYAEYVDPRSTSDISQALAIAWQKPRSDLLQRHVTQNLSLECSAKQLAQVYSH